MLAAENLGYFRGCPGLTRKAINNHLGIETATEKGWMTQVRQGAHTTRSSVTAPDETNNECTSIPRQEPGNSKTHKVYFTATNADNGLVYSDQNGRFPRTSNRSNKYLAIFYVYNVNALLSVPIKIIRYYHAAFFSPNKHRMIAADKLGYFRGCPGLTRKAINNHLGIETDTEKGWMIQVRQGAHTTRSSDTAPVSSGLW